LLPEFLLNFQIIKLTY